MPMLVGCTGLARRSCVGTGPDGRALHPRKHGARQRSFVVSAEGGGGRGGISSHSAAADLAAALRGVPSVEARVPLRAPSSSVGKRRLFTRSAYHEQ